MLPFGQSTPPIDPLEEIKKQAQPYYDKALTSYNDWRKGESGQIWIVPANQAGQFADYFGSKYVYSQSAPTLQDFYTATPASGEDNGDYTLSTDYTWGYRPQGPSSYNFLGRRPNYIVDYGRYYADQVSTQQAELTKQVERDKQTAAINAQKLAEEKANTLRLAEQAKLTSLYAQRQTSITSADTAVQRLLQQEQAVANITGLQVSENVDQTAKLRSDFLARSWTSANETEFNTLANAHKDFVADKKWDVSPLAIGNKNIDNPQVPTLATPTGPIGGTSNVSSTDILGPFISIDKKNKLGSKTLLG